ncbi:16S rRNA (cytidine(1402)-2'-O)-methyltransferase [Halioxenophilus aromaticivorans]|uniref:Ribosomal RNA small subunit methyltransferase I n=1 Tax=Halioxenophilus aromaticivorans TaxID=1306992 RepID=A0AAV3TYX3_9ALTE
MPHASGQGQLFIVATPIGNLGDMVPRAVETLQTVDVIAAEDTRHSSRLLSHFKIKTPMVAYHDHNDGQRTAQLIERLQSGQRVALISDAGTPLISDPGYRLVAEARAAGVVVIPIPGACALIAALSASGLPTDRFQFEGFLPAKQVARQKVLHSLADSTATMLFYEAPHRVVDSLQDIEQVLGGQRRVVLARELSKTFETFIDGAAAEVLSQVTADSNQQRGEMVLMVAGVEPVKRDIDPAAQQLMRLLMPHLPLKKAAAIVAEHCGLKKNQLYQWGLDQNDR